MKRCSKCKVERDESEFYALPRSSDGLQSNCKRCMRAANAEWVRRNPEKNAERERRRRLRTPGRSTAYVRAWRANNPEKAAAHNAPSDKRRDYDKARYRNDPARKDAVNRRFKELNKRRPEIKNAIIARRRALQKNALVPWGDKEKMRSIYAEAKRLERETGIKHHVDHIVPLQSKIVCGLHWEGNLQVLPATENHKKLNRVWPDMPMRGAY